MSIFDNPELIFSIYQLAHLHVSQTSESQRYGVMRPWRLPVDVDGREITLLVDTENHDKSLHDRLHTYSVRIYIEKQFDIMVTYHIVDQYIQTDMFKSKWVLYQHISDEEIEHYFMMARLQYGE